MVNENLVKDVVSEPYKYGFVTDIETEKISKGLNEDTIRLISEKKEEPEYLLNFRLNAFKNCLLYTSPSPRDLSTSRMPSSA